MFKAKIIFFFLLLLLMNCAIAMQKIHGVIPTYDKLIGGDSSLLESKKRFNNIEDFKDYDFKFPKQKYIIDPVLINLNDKNKKYKIILARGILELQSYNQNTGLFTFKLTLDNLVYSQIQRLAWTRNKTDIPINGTVYFDIDNNNYAIIKGKFDPSTKEIIPLKSKESIFYVEKNFETGVLLGKVSKEKDIPVTISVDGLG